MEDMEKFLQTSFVIISVVGSHAGEKIVDIFLHKKQDVKEKGKTYWLIQSNKAKTDQIQSFCREAAKKGESVFCYFIEPSQKGGARPTLHDKMVTRVSVDKQNWDPVPRGIKITGKISESSTALVFDQLEVLNEPTVIDLWNYSEFQTKSPVKIRLGASTVCCERKPSQGMRSRHRRVVGVGRLTAPYSLWLK